MSSEQVLVPGAVPRSEPIFPVDQEGQPLYLKPNISSQAIVSSSTFVSVKDNGAKGDGRTDDTVAIQNTINGSPQGATIYFPPGTYIISSTIQLQHSQTYLGSNDSYYGAILKQANNANLVALVAVTEFMTNANYSSDPIHVEKLYFDGNSSNNTNPPANGGHGIIFMSSDSIIRECWFVNIPRTAIVFSDVNLAGTVIINSSIENHVLDCKVNVTGQYGIWVRDQGEGTCTDGYIRDCVINTTASTSIFLERGAGWFLSGNHVYDCVKSGIVVNNAWATSIVANEIDGYGTDPTVAVNYYTGIGVTCIGPRPTIIEGNIIVSGESNPNTIYQHLSINGGASTDARCIVTGNDILGGYVKTTSSTPITTAASATIVVGSVTNMYVGQLLTIDAGSAQQENVTVTAIKQSAVAGGNTLTASFSKPHSGTYTITSSKPAANSLGIIIQSFGTQKTSGQPFYAQLALNRTDGVGQEYFCDRAATTVLAPSHMLGDVQSDGNLRFAGHIVCNGANASVSVGANNGTNAPAPTISGNDARGTVSFGCGANAAAGLQVNVQYAAAYDHYPAVAITPVNAATAQAGNIWYVSHISTGGFSIAATVALANTAQAANAYSFSYQVVG